MLAAQRVTAAVEIAENAADRRVVHRPALIVGQEVLLAHISDVAAFRILGEEVVEGLVLARADLLGDRLVPFLVLANTGSTSKMTPRNSKMRWRTTSPIEKRAWAMGGAGTGSVAVRTSWRGITGSNLGANARGASKGAARMR
jgi:hypothetical protein